MINQAFFIRVIIAVVCCIAILALIPLVFAAVGFPLTAPLAGIIRICVAAIAVLYIIRG